MFNRLRIFMSGRNGFDKLSVALIVVALIFYILSHIFLPLSIFALAAFLYVVWRALSKNLAKRREENYRFTNISGDIADALAKRRFRRQQNKGFKFITCPGCKSKLRLPRGKGKVSITCPRCGLKFGGKT